MSASAHTEEAYLSQLRSALKHLDPQDRDEIGADIQSHFSDARADGQSDQQTIQRLGPATTLAHAYLAELNADGRDGSARGSWIRGLRFGLLVAFGTVPSLLVSLVVAVIALAFLISGLAVTAGGFALLAGADPTWVKWPYPTAWAFLAGPAMAAVGVTGGLLLRAYGRFLARGVLELLGRKRR